MGTNRLRCRAGFSAVVSVLLAGLTAAPASAQEPPDLEPREGIEPGERHQADKAQSSSLAETDEELLGATGTEPVPVMIKLDYDSLAAYQGGIDDLEATSPAATGEELQPGSRAAQEYGDYVSDRESDFRSALARAVPQAEVRRSFEIVYGGVAATVPANSVEDILAIDGVVAVQEDTLEQPLTDSSPDFIGAPTLYEQLGGAANAGEGTILGNLDTGIWPEHPSFEDQGNLSAPPAPPGGGARECNYGDNPLTPEPDVFECQNKLIGGAHFTDTYDAQVGDDPLAGTARDGDGHGTHTSSTSAGNPLDSAEVFGTDRGPIKGIAPGAWVMEYKVCGPQGCFGSDSAAAVEQAILDGVDVINFSISGGSDPFSDPVELAFLDAYAAGVFVSASAGNEGPGASTANHLGPWTTTVAASTQTREFATTLSLTADNGDTFSVDGVTITDGIDPALPVVKAGDIADYGDDGCLEPAPAGVFDGMLVACSRGEIARAAKGFNVLQGGAAGMILYNPTLADVETDNHWLPTVHVADGTDLVAFLDGHSGITGSFPAGEARDGQGDVMAAFSSRGPGGLIIKPDVTAPGVQILAGNTPFAGDPAEGSGPPGELFQAIAGTSMSSPHVAGSGLLLTALHPDWTPGQIRSALMTSATTDVVKEDLTTPADPFDMGSGRIDLTQAGSVPLTFDETAEDYLTLGGDEVGAIHLNVPSINAPVMPGRVTTTRVATNVTDQFQHFQVSAETPEGTSISVRPRRLNLRPGESETITVTIEAPPSDEQKVGAIHLDGNGVDLHLPVAFVPTQGDVNLIQDCEPGTIPRGDTSTCTVTATNNSFNETTADVTTELERGLRITDVAGAEQTGSRTAELNDVTLAGREPGVPAVEPGALAGYLPLDDFGITPVPIGDEEIVNFNVPAFSYAGESWSSIGVVSNGYIVVGGGTSEDVNCCTIPAGPDPARPNNVLAPFWSDLDGSEAEGIFVATLTDGTNTWLVVEFRVNVFGTSDLQTFQTWIGVDGTEDITYAYDPANLPSDPGMPFLVGAENVLGQGDMTATLPTGDLRVASSASTPGESATYTVTVKGIRRGTRTVTSSLQAEGVIGTTIVTSDVEVTR